jgi:hypothetical protein
MSTAFSTIHPGGLARRQLLWVGQQGDVPFKIFIKKAVAPQKAGCSQQKFPSTGGSDYFWGVQIKEVDFFIFKYSVLVKGSCLDR